MAITVEEDYRHLSATKSTDFVEVEGAATRVFNVQFDTDTYVTTQAILMAVVTAGVPQLNTAHPYDPMLFAYHKSVTNYNSAKMVFEVTVEYKYETDPLAKKWEISWNFATSNEPVDTDINDKPILNSSDEPLDPPLTKDVDDLVLRIVRNESAFDPVRAAEYKGSINADWFYGFKLGRAQIKVIEGVLNRAAARSFYTVTYEIHFRWDGWQKRVLDQGFRTKTTAAQGETSTYQSIVDEDGNPLAQPAKLDGSGGRLAEGAAPVFNYYDLYREMNFYNLYLEG